MLNFRISWPSASELLLERRCHVSHIGWLPHVEPGTRSHTSIERRRIHTTQSTDVIEMGVLHGLHGKSLEPGEQRHPLQSRVSSEFRQRHDLWELEHGLDVHHEPAGEPPAWIWDHGTSRWDPMRCDRYACGARAPHLRHEGVCNWSDRTGSGHRASSGRASDSELGSSSHRPNG